VSATPGGRSHGPPDDAAQARWVRETPGASKRRHLNNAGAALQSEPALRAVTGHLALEAECGGYEAAALQRDAIARVYEQVGALLGARPNEIAIASSATAAYAQALSAFDFAAGDGIVTTRADYLSNRIMFESLAARRGVRVVEVADLPAGGVDPEAVERELKASPAALVALTWIPTFGGLVQRAEDVGAICARYGVPYLVDACQAVGQLAVDVRAVQCDFLAATARKFLRGPRGIGFLHVSERALDAGRHPLLTDMRGGNWPATGTYTLYGGARRFEQWEMPHALVLGMGAAAAYATAQGIVETSRRAHALAAYARDRLGDIPGVRSLDRGERLSAIAAFECRGRKSSDLVTDLRARGINTSAQELDENLVALNRLEAASLLRVSPHYYNTAADVDALADALTELMASASARS